MADLNNSPIERANSSRFELDSVSIPSDLFPAVLLPLLQKKTGVSQNPQLAEESAAASLVKPVLSLSTEDWLKSRFQSLEERRQKENLRSKARHKQQLIQ